jgi:hypothetical protein
MTCLDEYLRAGLHHEVDEVLHTAQRWHESPSSVTRMDRMNEAIDALANAFVDFNEAVDEYTQPDDSPPGELKHGRGGGL